MYSKVAPAVDSVGVISKEKFGIFIYFTVVASLPSHKNKPKFYQEKLWKLIDN